MPTMLANRADLQRCGVPPDALRDISEEEQDVALTQASGYAHSRLAQRYRLPLLHVGDDLKQIVCILAAYRLLVFRGLNPDASGNEGIKTLYTEAKQTLTDVAMGRATLDVVDTSPEPTEAPDVGSAPTRGFDYI